MRRLIHIVDDESAVRASTSFMLRQRSFDTEIYASGAELLAVKRLDRGCILLDVHMPGMGGLEVHDELIKRGVDLPVIFLDGDVPLAVQAIQQGAVDFLEKPYEPDELIAVIEHAFAIAESGDLARRIKADAAARLRSLTPRGAQILQGLRAGMSNKAIARWLGLSPRTIEAYRATMMAKMGVSGLSQALRIANDGGLPPISIDQKAGSG